MSATKLTETQQIVLSAAARRADRCVMLPPRLKGAAAQRVVKKLVDLGLIEEVRARGDLPVWRRDHGGCPMALRITRDGSERIRIGPRGSGKDSVLESEGGEQEKGLVQCCSCLQRAPGHTSLGTDLPNTFISSREKMSATSGVGYAPFCSNHASNAA